jgi:hypothetical protein
MDAAIHDYRGTGGQNNGRNQPVDPEAVLRCAGDGVALECRKTNAECCDQADRIQDRESAIIGAEPVDDRPGGTAAERSVGFAFLKQLGQ